MDKTYDYLVETGGEYLEHYGVKGMKWGVRNDPYYAKGKALHLINKYKKKGKIEKAKQIKRDMDKVFKKSDANRYSDKQLATYYRKNRNRAIGSSIVGTAAMNALGATIMPRLTGYAIRGGILPLNTGSGRYYNAAKKRMEKRKRVGADPDSFLGRNAERNLRRRRLRLDAEMKEYVRQNKKKKRK